MSKKFPRIPHLPWSPGGTRDDRRLDESLILKMFIGVGNHIIITEKLDGSNLCLTSNDVFSRSHSGSPIHSSFDLAKKMHAEVAHNIPDRIDVFGEWCFAIHSIEYDRLPGPYPFYIFGIRDKYGWFCWDEVISFSSELGLNIVPVLFNGIVEDNFRELTENLACRESKYGEEREGIVIWPYNGLASDEDFSQQTAKWVKENHPKDPDEHWLYKPVRKQGIK